VKPRKLFHTIVVLGAALTSTACSGDDGAMDSGTADSAVMDSATADSSAMDSAVADASDASTMLDSMLPSDASDDAADGDGMVLIL
jgi:hypothetical protein